MARLRGDSELWAHHPTGMLQNNHMHAYIHGLKAYGTTASGLRIVGATNNDMHAYMNNDMHVYMYRYMSESAGFESFFLISWT